MDKEKQTLQEFRTRSSQFTDLEEGVAGMNAAFQQFRRLYQSGTRYTAKQWFAVVADILDGID